MWCERVRLVERLRESPQEVHLKPRQEPRTPDRECFGMTARIRDFLRNRTDDGPCLIVDLDVVRDNYQAFAKALPDTRVFYAVKANPAPEVLSLLASLGSCFDTASVAEIEMADRKSTRLNSSLMSI